MSLHSSELHNYLIEVFKNDVAHKIKIILKKEKEAFASLDFSNNQKKLGLYNSSRNKRNMLKSLNTCKFETKTKPLSEYSVFSNQHKLLNKNLLTFRERLLRISLNTSSLQLNEDKFRRKTERNILTNTIEKSLLNHMANFRNKNLMKLKDNIQEGIKKIRGKINISNISNISFDNNYQKNNLVKIDTNINRPDIPILDTNSDISNNIQIYESVLTCKFNKLSKIDEIGNQKYVFKSDINKILTTMLSKESSERICNKLKIKEKMDFSDYKKWFLYNFIKISTTKKKEICFFAYDRNGDKILNYHDLLSIIKNTNESEYIKSYAIDVNFILSIFVKNKSVNQKIEIKSLKINKQKLPILIRKNEKLKIAEKILKCREKLLNNSLSEGIVNMNGILDEPRIYMNEFINLTFPNEIPLIFDDIAILLTGFKFIKEKRPISSASTQKDNNNTDFSKNPAINTQIAIQLNCLFPNEIISSFLKLCKNPKKIINETYITFRGLLKKLPIFLKKSNSYLAERFYITLIDFQNLLKRNDKIYFNSFHLWASNIIKSPDSNESKTWAFAMIDEKNDKKLDYCELQKFLEHSKEYKKLHSELNLVLSFYINNFVLNLNRIEKEEGFCLKIYNKVIETSYLIHIFRKRLLNP